MVLIIHKFNVDGVNYLNLICCRIWINIDIKDNNSTNLYDIPPCALVDVSIEWDMCA